MLRIKTRSIGTLLLLALLTLSMGFVGWLVTRQTAATVYRFESLTLPEISTALSLSEGVAQLAAISPYIADAARPFQLQGERSRLEQKFNELNLVAGKISDTVFRSELEQRLNKLFAVVSELIATVSDELFLREDILALRFDIDDLASTSTQAETDPDPVLQQVVADLHLLIQPERLSLVNSNDAALQKIENLLLSIGEGDQGKVKKAEVILTKIATAYGRFAEYQRSKRYLISLIRAQSEELTAQVNVFVGSLQKSVVRQREGVAETVAHGQLWVLLMSLLIVVAFAYSTWFNYGVTRDLEAVTRDMTRLAEGHTDTPAPVINRADELGDLVRSFSVFRRDAMQMRQVSQDLKAQSKLLETVFNQIHDGLSVFSKNQQLVTWNRRYLEIFELSAQEVISHMSLVELQQLMSRKPHKTLSIDGHAIDMSDLNLARLESAQTFERHYDSGKVIEFRSQPMPEGGFVTLYRDLSERRAMEQQLIQSQKMDVFGQLTGGIAHDFNNLLAAILGNLQLLEKTENLDSTQQKQIHRALHVTEKGVSLVQRLLAFSRKQQLFPESINADDLIVSMLDLVEYSVGKKVEVVTDLQASQAKIFVDPSQLENAILNLALNSSQAMPEGGQLFFRTAVHHEADHKPFLTLVVEDTGVGISAELQKRVLEPFFTTKPVGKGSGLGLSMVYGFVCQSGGQLQIDSSPGHGAQVALIFPLGAQENTCQTLATDLPATISLPAHAYIAIVEDNLDVQKTIVEQFESLGFSVDSYSQAEDLLTPLLEHPLAQRWPDLILTDINLQGEISGTQLLAICRERRPQQKVVLTSGMPREILEQRFGLQSNALLLEKPISMQTLREVIDIL